MQQEIPSENKIQYYSHTIKDDQLLPESRETVNNIRYNTHQGNESLEF